MDALDVCPDGIRASGMRVVPDGGDAVVVKRGLAEVRLGAPGIADLLGELSALADGTLDADGLVAVLSERYEHAGAVVDALMARRILHRGDDGPIERFWAGVAPRDDGVGDRLRAARVRISGRGPIAEQMRKMLRDNGVHQVVDESAPGAPDLWCATTEGPADPGLLDLSRRALAEGTPFLPTWIDELIVRVGPLTFPRDTACLRCCLWRLESHDTWRDVRRALRQDRAGAEQDAGHLPTMVTTAAAVAAGEATLHLAGRPTRVVGRTIEINPVPFAVSARRVLKVPRCPDCSGTADQGSPVLLDGSQLQEPVR